LKDGNLFVQFQSWNRILHIFCHEKLLQEICCYQSPIPPLQEREFDQFLDFQFSAMMSSLAKTMSSRRMRGRTTNVVFSVVFFSFSSFKNRKNTTRRLSVSSFGVSSLFKKGHPTRRFSTVIFRFCRLQSWEKSERNSCSCSIELIVSLFIYHNYLLFSILFLL
jgi:hypothetical protein